MTRISRFSTILAATVVLAAAAVLLMVVGMNRGAPSGDLAHAADPGAEVEAEGVQAAGGLTTKAIDLPAVQAHCRSQTGQHYDDCVTVIQVLDALAGDCVDCSDLTYIISTTTGRVIKIKLHRKGLKGHIPAEIGSLEMLEELWLYTNELSGTIPPEMGNLANLTWLFVSDNDLSGQIPETLNNLSLDRLWLHKNNFTGCVPHNLTLTREYKVDPGLAACAPPAGDGTPTPVPTAPAGTPTPEPNPTPVPNATPTPTPRPPTGDNTAARLTAVEGRLTAVETRVTALEATRTPEPSPTPVPQPTTPKPFPERTHVILRVVQVTEDWVPFSVAGGWTQAVIQKESDVLRYYEAAIWEETDSVHLYAFPNDYDGLFGLDEDIPDADVIAYREQYAISVHSDMPEMWSDRRSDFLRIAFEDFVSRLVELHPEADHHLMYHGHGGPGGNLFAGQLKHDDAGAFLATWTRLLGKPLGVIDMGGPCSKGGYDDLANFCRHASYYVASDLPNGGYSEDDWTSEKYHETDPETQYHRLLASNETLEEALIERVELRRKKYEYSMNNQIRDQVEQANYVYSCARFNDFSEAFELFVDVTTIQAPSYDLYQLMLDHRAPPALFERFRDVFVHGVDNRDFFEWKVTANGMISPTAARLLPPPPSLGLDAFYEKYLDADGLPIIASSRVPDAALFRARDIIDEMLVNRPDLRATIAGLGRRVTVVADSEVITDIPEFRELYAKYPGIDWNQRVQGGGLSGNGQEPTTAIWGRNLLCGSGDAFPDEDILVHEFAHTVLNMGVEHQSGGQDFRNRLDAAYEEAQSAGLWKGTYAGENPEEYWAEGVQSWFGLNDPPGLLHNNINTRSELDTYDPTLSGLIREVFGDTSVVSSCHLTKDVNLFRIQGRAVGPDDQPLEGIGLWAWQGESKNSRSGTTGSDGTFTLLVPDGSFTLDIYADFDAGCTFVGWLGPGGFTASREDAVRVEVNGTDAIGIVIKLPKHLDELPFIEHCS